MWGKMPKTAQFGLLCHNKKIFIHHSSVSPREQPIWSKTKNKANDAVQIQMILLILD